MAHARARRSTSGASDDAAVTEFVSIPTQIAYVRQLGRGVSLGLGYFVPQASNLIFSSVFALRYAYSHGELTRFLVDPEAPETLATESLPGTLIAHEIGLYVGSGLEF